MPLFSKPARRRSGENFCFHTSFITHGNLRFVRELWRSTWRWICSLHNFFIAANTATSKGCSMWLVCGGRTSTSISFLTHMSTKSSASCELCPSSMSSFLPGGVFGRNTWVNHFAEILSLVHPLSEVIICAQISSASKVSSSNILPLKI